MIYTPMKSEDGRCVRAWFQQCKRHTALLMNARQRKQAMKEAEAAAAAETANNRFMTLSLPPTPPAWHLAKRSLSYDMKNPAYYFNPDNIGKVLISMSILGWLAFGTICLLCINGHGRAGRWIPEWYLDSEGTRWDKVAVVAWWLAVVVGHYLSRVTLLRHQLVFVSEAPPTCASEEAPRLLLALQAGGPVTNKQSRSSGIDAQLWTDRQLPGGLMG
ncbi:hypothetical protein E4U21_006319 [Claviceps maximensis]|nr:hypothetical protein E4U21_006319 [Claviceps maximensis]